MIKKSKNELLVSTFKKINKKKTNPLTDNSISYF